MKNKFQTLLCTLMLCTMFFVAFAGKEVQAAAKAPVCPKSQNVYYYVDDRFTGVSVLTTLYSSAIYIKDLAPDAVFSNLKSSNKNVRVSDIAELYRMDAVAVSILAPVKEGTKSKISFTIAQNGKKYNLSCNITIKKAKNPLKSLKIGNKEYASSYKEIKDTKKVKFPDLSSAKLTYTPAPGFKIKYISVRYRDGKGKCVQSGEKVNAKNISSIYIRYGVTEKPTYYTTPGEYTYSFKYLPLSGDTYELVSAKD